MVVPSLPGYGFSAAPGRHGCNGRACAERFQALMAALGYRDYLAQGGDWGSHIATWLGALDPACAALHLNLVFARKPRSITSSMRLYYEQRQHPSDPPLPEYVDKPTAVAAFPEELHLPPPA